MEKDTKKINNICKLLFKDTCKNIYPRVKEENFLVLIADSVLQQGMNYTYFVLPRLKHIKINYSYIKNISKIPIDNEYIEILLQLKNKRKTHIFKEIITLLSHEKVDTYIDMVNWLNDKKNHTKLLSIHGFGNKTLDYMLNLFGYQTIPIDRHIYSFLQICDVKTKNYQFASNLMNNVAKENDFCKITFDKEIWNYVRDIRI